MKYLHRLNKYQKPYIIFIHGFQKDAETWNKTEFGTIINIEKRLSKIYNTIIVKIEEDDYKKNVYELTFKIYCYISFLHIDSPKKIVVAHGHGCFYAMSLAINHDVSYHLLLLDPIFKIQSYFDKIKYLALENPEDEIACSQYENYFFLPNHSEIKSQTILRIHLSNREDREECIQAALQSTQKNMKSRLVLENTFHTMHWEIPESIIHHIEDLVYERLK